MRCCVTTGIRNLFGAFVPLSSKYFVASPPYARKMAREWARMYTQQSPKYIAEVSTVVDGAHINVDIWVGGYERGSY